MNFNYLHIKAVRDGAVYSVGFAMPSKSIGRCLIPFASSKNDFKGIRRFSIDRISPMDCC